MAQFQYRAADAEGKVVEGTLEALEAATVVARLQDRGLIPIRVGQAGTRKEVAGYSPRPDSRRWGRFPRPWRRRTKRIHMERKC